MLLSNALLCAIVSIPSAKPDTIHTSVFSNPAIILVNAFLALSLALREPTAAIVLSKLHKDKSPNTNKPVGGVSICFSKYGYSSSSRQINFMPLFYM